MGEVLRIRRDCGSQGSRAEGYRVARSLATVNVFVPVKLTFFRPRTGEPSCCEYSYHFHL